MEHYDTDTLLSSIFFSLLGFLLGSVLSDIPIKTSDISSMLIAIAAIYGVLKWRKQHDYQQEKIDKKEIIKLIRKSLTYVIESKLARHELSENLTSYVKNKNKDEDRIFNKRLVDRSLVRVDDAKKPQRSMRENRSRNRHQFDYRI